MTTLAANTEFTLLGKAARGGALWYRVQAKDPSGGDRFGWIQASTTDLQGLSKHTAELPAAPPDCAIPAVNTVDHFTNVDVRSGSLGVWQSNVHGDTAFVVDLFRSSAGERSEPLTFRIHVDGTMQVSFDIPASKGVLLMRDRIFQIPLQTGSRVELSLGPVNSSTLSELQVFTTVFAVPRGCEFNR